MSVLNQEETWFENNVWNQVSNDPTGVEWDLEVQVNDTVTCEQSGDRLVEADEYLKDNFDYYGDSDGCIVLDHYWDGTYYGCAFVGGINGQTEDNKTTLVDYEAKTGDHLPSYDTNGIGIRHYLGMEPGHLYGAKHPDDSVNIIFGEVTYMFNNEGPECENQGLPEKAIPSYSNCAESTINDYMINEFQ
ncbi:MAG: hypothetical protein ABEJ42_06930 [Halobacteriaceae archaeon]